MATATATLTQYAYPKGRDNTQRRSIIYGTCAIQAAAATYAAGGLAITWSQIAERNPTTTPAVAWFYSNAPVSTNDYIYVWNKSTNKLQIYTGAAAQTGLTELTDGASIPAGVSGDTIEFRAEFLRYI